MGLSPSAGSVSLPGAQACLRPRALEMKPVTAWSGVPARLLRVYTATAVYCKSLVIAVGTVEAGNYQLTPGARNRTSAVHAWVLSPRGQLRDHFG